MSSVASSQAAPRVNGAVDDSGGPVLEVRNLKKYFPIKTGVLSRVTGQVKAVDDVSFEIYPGETFALVGESG